MSSSDTALDERPSYCHLELENGRALICPASPEECTWVAVLLDDAEIHRTQAAALAAAPFTELTRLADTLIPGRPRNRRLPQPANQDPSTWHECAIAAADSGRTMRFDAAPDQVERIRICHPSGEEIAYWVTDEFNEDAADCLGASIGALIGGEGGITPQRPRTHVPEHERLRRRPGRPSRPRRRR